MSIFKNFFSKKTNVIRPENGFYYYYNSNVDDCYKEVNLYEPDNFRFYKNNQLVSYFENVHASKIAGKTTFKLSINHFAVDTTYLSSNKNGGYDSLKALAKFASEKYPKIERIEFKLMLFASGVNINGITLNHQQLANLRADLFRRINATNINIGINNIVTCTWEKHNWL